MFGGKFNILDLMKNAHKIQDMMKTAQEDLEKTEFEVEAGAGAVKMRMNAKYVVKEISIDDEILKEPKEVLQDLLVAAFNSGGDKIAQVMKDKMGGASQFLNMIEGEKDK